MGGVASLGARPCILGAMPTLGHGKICHLELPAADAEASAAFYERVFGWRGLRVRAAYRRRSGGGHGAVPRPGRQRGRPLPRAVTGSIQPQLWVSSPSRAVAFYEAAFGATVLHRVGEGDDIVAQLAVGDAAFWVTNASAELKRFSPDDIGGATGRTLLVVDDPDTVVRQAVAAGATETSPVADEHGWRLGRIVDPFGHEWEVGKPTGDWPPG